MSVPWDFLPCPISSAKHAYEIFSHNCHWNVSLPSGASLWNGKFGRVEGQNTTIELIICIKMDLNWTKLHTLAELISLS